MAEFKHGPQPWKWIEPSESDDHAGILVDASGKEVIHLGSAWHYEQEAGYVNNEDGLAENHKRLIRAAPKLLAALNLAESVFSGYEKMPGGSKCEALWVIREALAEATGQDPWKLLE